jgi:hypothetical protein
MMQTGERDRCSCGEQAWMHINGREGPKHLCRRCYALHSRRRDMRSPTYDYDRTDYVFPQRWRALTETHADGKAWVEAWEEHKQAGERDMEIE